MSEVTTSSIPQSNVVLVDYVKRETTQSPKLAEDRPYRPKAFQGYTNSWYNGDSLDSDAGSDETDSTEDTLTV